MKERLGLFLLAAISLSACNEQKDNATNNASSANGSGRSYSVFGQIRPKVDPAMVRQIEEEDLEKQRQKQAALEKQLAMQNQQNQQSSGYLDPSQRNLPDVNTSPIAGALQPGTTISGTSSRSTTAAQPMDTSAWQPPAGNTPPPSQPVSAYNMNYTSPAAGFVPPPPAVTVTGSVNPYGAPPPPQMYAANPYPYYPYPPQQYQQPAEAQKPQRSPGSLFGSSDTASAGDGESDEPRKKKEKNLVVITPVGMQAHSSFKQRDDLKALWQGMLNTNALAPLTRDEKIAQQLRKVEVATPSESTKGMLSVSQRTIDNLFKNAALDKKFWPQVKKSQSDLIQAYYRYLFSYNKFSLTQQTLAARQQEVELADSSAEKQRAAADLSQAQQEAESSKEDMRSAQNDLAAVSGAQSARLIIGRVSGVAPSLESLAQAEPQGQDQQASSSIGGFFNSVGSAFGLGRKQESPPEAKVAKAESIGKAKDKEKEKGKEKKKKGKADAPQIAALPQEPPVPSQSTSVESAAVSPAPPQGAVSFELKDVKTTPRKAILRVSIRNNGDDNFSFDTDSVSVSEGNRKLADAAVRAEFDATIVQPNQEVTGTVTIFGLPWNDRLSVSLSDGGRTILLHR